MKQYKIITLCMMVLAAALTSCGDVDDEITSLLLNRNLSPINLTAKNVGETTADIQWTASERATSYNLEIFADDSLTFAGSPLKTITGIETTAINVTGLLFDTQYSVRVQAVTAGDDSRTSKWNGAYFRTGAKQFLKNPTRRDCRPQRHSQVGSGRRFRRNDHRCRTRHTYHHT